MKYYGIKQKINREKIFYIYIKNTAKLLSLISIKKRKYWKDTYQNIINDDILHMNKNNSIPSGYSFTLNSFIISDLIRREDIKNLKKGLQFFVKKRKSNKFFYPQIDSLDSLFKKINQMDASLLTWYNTVKCGFFEFKNHHLKKSIEYFSIKIQNVNSAYLSLEFEIYLTQKKSLELEKIINCNYHEKTGYAYYTLTPKEGSIGSLKNFTTIHYNDGFLKSDRIYEFLTYIEWEFMNELSKYFPFVLHKKNIIPPRIEIYSTDVNYQKNTISFWNSIGILAHSDQKIFFNQQLSERYGNLFTNNRIVYVIKDNNIKIKKDKSILSDTNTHLIDCSNEYFKFLFLKILSKEAGKILINHKHMLDKIKLKKNHLSKLLKLRYDFSLAIDDYKKYTRDNIWDNSKKALDSLYKNYNMHLKSENPFYLSYSNFCDYSIADSKKIDSDINIVLNEFLEKKEILQNLSDYKNNVHNYRINVIMMILAIITLYFVIFPDKAIVVANIIKDLYIFLYIH